MIDVERLKVFVAFARERNVQATADELGISQPTVSHHLKQLSKECGVRLLVKNGRSLELTQEGQLLAERGARILAELAHTETQLRAVGRADTGLVRLAAFPSAMAVLVPELIVAMPHIQLDVVDAEPEQARRMLERREVDIALTFRYPEEEGAKAQVLFEENLMLVTPRGVGQGVKDVRDVASATWLTGCQQCTSHMLGVLSGVGVNPRLGYASDDFVAVQALIAAGLGVTLLPELALRAFRDDRVEVVPVAGLSRSVCVEALPHVLQSAPVKAVWDMVFSCFATS
ncbi:LysR family transcriptional regulator [Corynebacterium felinum]|uniref:DNA-binding transcriptional LysR family regulator n=1 Tax=Corynebacterium felinum TaxID=131318 RepID=A0ABU2BBJ8_9CORY|nr:LysR family transcriptional regulator [Corynebacterium felinum]MDF5821827.1 LysR family transcriptional regulator [Corynebacterium felinum]MDR7355364.1 DNA-binding transcriptional LysR family regulator [Corynebacterium felinum]WJY94716.1 HTH-type transcriptional regulator CysL [Corynebacterium felinum]